MEQKPSYTKLYSSGMQLLCNNLSGDQSDLVFKLVDKAKDASAIDGLGMCVVLVPRIKQQICQELGWKSVASLD